jgi:ABC-2 type transport system ATP-binding protein
LRRDGVRMSNKEILRCEHLTKCYVPGKYVLKDFNIGVPEGKILGLLGPNGCGKSTFLKLVAGLLVPNAGTIEIAGVPRSEESNALISYLPERTYLTPNMYVEEFIELFKDFYQDFDAETATRMLGDLAIPLNERLSALSKGMKEKTQLVMVMSRKARLYMLDEPIGGVDPAAREYILNTIIGNYNPTASVIITTHLISDIEPVLDEFAFMTYGGKIIRAGNADAVRRGTGKTLDELFREVFRCSENA